MDFEYPKMLYRFPATGQGTVTLEGAQRFDTLEVDGADAEAAATAQGWRTTWPDARDVGIAAMAAAAAAAANTAPPTRAELEQKARELGIAFDGRTSDKKLGDLIKATLET